LSCAYIVPASIETAAVITSREIVELILIFIGFLRGLGGRRVKYGGADESDCNADEGLPGVKNFSPRINQRVLTIALS
jgi:hypothetical protein